MESYDLLLNAFSEHSVPHCSKCDHYSVDQEDCVLENVDGDLAVCDTTSDWNSTVVIESVPVCVVSGQVTLMNRTVYFRIRVVIWRLVRPQVIGIPPSLPSLCRFMWCQVTLMIAFVIKLPKMLPASES